MGDNYKFVQNRICEYFPCHEIGDEEKFNCLFCFCPLYMLGKDCGGNYSYNERGVKNCSKCLLPHIKESGYNHVLSKMGLIMERTKNKVR